MDSVSPFTSHFARLVWLESHQPAAADEIKKELRNALAQLSAEAQHIVLHDVSMAVSNAVNLGAESEQLAWLSELSVRMSAHSIRAFEFEAATPAREVSDVAKALSGMPRPGDDGEAIDQALLALSLTGVTAHIGPMGFVRRASAEHRTIPSPVGAMASIPLESFSAQGRTPTPPSADSRRSSAEAQLLQDQLMPLAKPDEGASELVGRLDAALQAPNVIAVVDDVARAAEDRAREGKWVELVEVMSRMHEHHDRLHDGDAKRAFLMGARRLERPALMHGIARLLPQRRTLREAITLILSRAGETGADALIDNLVASDLAAERRAFRDALGECPSAVAALLHLLDDERWFVVRNAVELLGELGATEADGRIATLLSHRETRVRRAVAVALGRLATSKAVLALLQAVNDPSPDVRLQVVLGLGATRNPRSVPWLIEALESEADVDVQGALLSALGQTPTEDSVARLARAAEPGGMLRRKPVVIRQRAIDALGEAGTPAALQVLRGLLQDRDREVRESAQKALSRHAPDRL